MSALSVILPLAVLLLAIGWGFLIGMRRTRARFFVVLLCLVLAIVATVSVRSLSYEDVSTWIASYVANSNSEALRDLWTMVENSEALQDIALSGGGAVLAPIVFFITFFMLSAITWVICYIIFIIAAIVRAASGKGRRRARPIRTVVYATLQWVITMFVLVTPIACYTASLPEMVEVAADMGVFEDLNVSADEIRASAQEVTDDPLLKVYNTLGGKQVVASMTSFEVNGEETTVPREMTALAKFASNLLTLANHEIQDYGAAEAKAIGNLTESFEDSVMLPSLAGEIIYYTTDAWEQNESFMGVEKPELGEGKTTQLFTEAFDHILDAFQGDARKSDNLREDFATLSELVSIMANDGIFRTLRSGDMDQMIRQLSSGTTLADMVEVLHGNSRFSILVTDLTNIGMRVIAEALNLPENSEELYENFKTEIADAVNEVKASGKTAEELAEDLKTALDNSGVEFDTDPTVLELYATALLEDYQDVETVTPEDIGEFFKVFDEVSGAVVNNEAKSDSDMIFLSETVPLSENSNRGIYSNLSAEDLRSNTAAGIMTQFVSGLQLLARKDLSEEAFVADATELMETLLNQSSRYRDDSTFRATLLQIINKMMPENLKGDILSQTVALCSAETLSTVAVTLEDLLTSASADGQKLTDAQIRTDAQMVQTVFANAMDLMDAMASEDDPSDEGSLGKLSGVMENLGQMLDSMSELSTVGGEKTDKLATAVLQSETVRKSTGLSMKESSEMVGELTKKNEDGSKPKFEESLSNLSAGSDIVLKIKNNEQVSEDEVHSLLENMTPQTAGALKVLITEERLGDFGVKDPEKRRISADLIRNLLEEMGNREGGEEQYREQAKGIARLFDLAIAASKQTDKNHLFRHDGADEDSILGTADEVVAEILGSDMACRAIVRTMQDETAHDPFGLKIHENTESEDYQACRAAIENYYASHPDTDRDYVTGVAALFGVEVTID